MAVSSEGYYTCHTCCDMGNMFSSLYPNLLTEEITILMLRFEAGRSVWNTSVTAILHDFQRWSNVNIAMLFPCWKFVHFAMFQRWFPQVESSLVLQRCLKVVKTSLIPRWMILQIRIFNVDSSSSLQIRCFLRWQSVDLITLFQRWNNVRFSLLKIRVFCICFQRWNNVTALLYKHWKNVWFVMNYIYVVLFQIIIEA
jgi:hypothetical protein